MIAYLESSVVLRRVLGQSGQLREWTSIKRGIGSALVEVECLRTLDRARLRGALTDVELAASQEAIHRVLDALEVVGVTRTVLSRASQPFSTLLGTLDAVHLASALLWREASGEDLVMATHDMALANAARANGLPVVGV